MTKRSAEFLDRLGLRFPIIQAPMAGVSSPAMAAAVAAAGGLGSIGLGAADAKAAGEMLQATRKITNQGFHVNVFCHEPARVDAALELAWLQRLRPEFARYGAEPPASLRQIYKSFVEDDAVLELLLTQPPAVVSFHFGLPSSDKIRRLREAGIYLMASATNLDDARCIAEAGIDAVIAQGYEAGGHRGVFQPASPDDKLGTMALTRLLIRRLEMPVIAAGGIMDGAGIAAALSLGAAAAQLGTAFVLCPESLADEGYRAAMQSVAAEHTVMTTVISGRPARCLANRFTRWGSEVPSAQIPAYPTAYDAGKALHAAAKATSEFGYGAQWAGQGAPLARSMPAAELVLLLARELEKAQ